MDYIKKLIFIFFLLFTSMAFADVIDDESYGLGYISANFLKLDCSNDPLTNALDLPTIYNSLGNLKIMPDVQGDVGLFGDTDVANGVDGKTFSVNRRAAEGDTYLNFYVNDDQTAYIDSNWDISIRSNLASGVIELGAISTNIVRLIGTVNAIGEPTGIKNLPLRHYGYITNGAAQRYVTWDLQDGDDYYHLTKSGAQILGLKIEMPLDLVANALTTLSTGTFGSTYQAILGDDGNYSFYGIDGTTTTTLNDGTYAINATGPNHFISGTMTVDMFNGLSQNLAWDVPSFWGGYLGGSGGAAYFYDTVVNSVYLADGTYAINATGDSLFTGAVTITSTLGAGATTLTTINVGTNTLVANLAGYTGNVGIGTATPSTKLQIYGGTVYTNIWLVAAGLGYGDPTAVTTVGDGDKILFLNAGTAKTGYGTYGDNGLWIQSSAPLTSKAFSVWNGVNGTSMTERFTVLGSGKTGINTVAPTAYLHLPAGTATATEAPLKFTSGVFNTTAELGTMEYDGQNYKLNGRLFLNSGGIAYANPLGSGNRSLTLTLTTTATYVNTLVQYINGNTTSSSFYWNNQAASGLYIRFDFGVAKIITEAKHYQGDTSSHGTWKWQGSNNAVDWTDIGATFTYGGATTQTMTTLSGNITAYRYYQMLGTAGNMSSNPYIYEMEFKIGIASQFAVDALGNVSTLGTITGLLRPPAGTVIAGTAPLKFTTQVNPLTTPEAGTIQYVGTNFLLQSTVDGIAFRQVTEYINSATADTLDLHSTKDTNVFCGAGYTLELQTNVYEDLQFQVSSAKTNPANVAPTWETFTATTSEYAFSVDDEVDTYANEIPHNWVEGTQGDAHLHVTTKAINNVGVRYAKFTVTFAYADTNEAWVEAPLTAELTIPNPTAALTNLYLDLGNLTLTNYLIGAQIKCRVKRIAATGGTEYSGDIYITQVGVHLQRNTVGSRAELIK